LQVVILQQAEKNYIHIFLTGLSFQHNWALPVDKNSIPAATLRGTFFCR